MTLKTKAKPAKSGNLKTEKRAAPQTARKPAAVSLTPGKATQGGGKPVSASTPSVGPSTTPAAGTPAARSSKAAVAAASLLKNATPDELADLAHAPFPHDELTTATLADPGLANRLEAISRLALDKLEDILLAPCAPDDERLRKDQLAAAQVVLNTQVRVDENKLKERVVQATRRDWFAISRQLREDNPQLYRLRSPCTLGEDEDDETGKLLS